MPWNPNTRNYLLGTYAHFRERYCRQGVNGTFTKERLIGWDDPATFAGHAHMALDDLRRLILQFTHAFPKAHHRSPAWSSMTPAVAAALGLVGQPIFRPIIVMGHSIKRSGTIHDKNRFGLCEFSGRTGIYLWVNRHFIDTAIGLPAVVWLLWRQDKIDPHGSDRLCYPNPLHPDGAADPVLTEILEKLGSAPGGLIKPERETDHPVDHEEDAKDIWYPGRA